MIKNLYLLPVLLFALSFVACDESEEVSKYANWRERNEAFIDSLQAVCDLGEDPDLKCVVYDRDKKVNIFYKVLPGSPLSPKPDQTEPPFFTSKVKMVYRGMYIDETVFAKATAPYHYTTMYKDLTVFDSNMSEDNYNPDFDSPAEFTVSGVIGGWTQLLQIMKCGDRFEAYIPYQAGYGESSSSSGIMAYSTLIFDMEMVSIEYYPK
ncbi:MAG: FKBP-type peptidyl-prolyl cis-trans isomerase [Mediterranea sp.]|jgi:FKBP-type peptidyl-prolyl cis-trans isomerase FklB|nr:FKBP-type peptidyl-prolyl cis-trans isomerase [Mediterranea sp.]